IHSSLGYKSPDDYLKEYLNNNVPKEHHEDEIRERSGNPPALNNYLKRQQSRLKGLAAIYSDNDTAYAALEPCGLPFIIN
ncbi:MAG: hypothetical protein M0012_01340, partial [Deltaproteobacteria bacterium]|nr:hypothetical protein [Deltaproteobacteria bacterium]